jgi:branched-chain amino acid aminotransferase
VSLNGRVQKNGKAAISMFDNSLLYAEGLFETFMAVDDNLVFLEDHLRRLATGARVIGLKLPVSTTTLKRWLKRVTSAHPAKVKKVRLTVTAGESRHWVGISGKPQVVIGVTSHDLQTEPYRLQVSQLGVDQKSVFRAIKTISYAIHAAAVKQAHQSGYDDALMINNHGQVAEATSANIFWAVRGKLYTTPLASGCLDGVTRKNVIRVATRKGLSVSEQRITLDRLVQADEVFVTSSLKLVLPVGMIVHGRRRYRLAPGPIAGNLRQAVMKYQRIVL